MTDYNDGKWHGWNGGDCPVHPESVVEVIFDNVTFRSSESNDLNWNHEVSSHDSFPRD